MAVCHFHPDRPGIGVCMRCRVAVCADCRTRVDGVNHCHACLKVLGRRAPARPPGDPVGAVAPVVLLGGAWLVLLGVLYLLQGSLAP